MEPHIHHHRQADDFGRRLEVAKGGTLGHPERLRDDAVGIKPSSSDSAIAALRLPIFTVPPNVHQISGVVYENAIGNPRVLEKQWAKPHEG